jgi:cell wall-associated NlpC family hydrolase
MMTANPGNAQPMASATTPPLDRRRNAYRPDLADVRLQQQVEAARYVDGVPACLREAVVALRQRPDHAAPRDSEALFGDRVRVFERRNGWAWLQLERDGYVGYLAETAITDARGAPTHRLLALTALVYSEPSPLAEPVHMLPLNAAIEVAGRHQGFAELAGGGYIGARFLADWGQDFEPDHAATAERFLGVPYLFGGCSAIGGIDCSGLVQMALAAAGIAAPRDSDMQAAEVGGPVVVGDDLDGLERGDLVFWPGHTGIMVSPTEIVNANATYMSVTREPLADVADRARKDGPRVGGVRRLSA